jgi:hypothetical protein
MDWDDYKEAMDRLHQQIMNMPMAKPGEAIPVPDEPLNAYRRGFRDARHAAAELVASSSSASSES